MLRNKLYIRCLFGLDDLAAAGIVSAGASLIGSIINTSSQKDTQNKQLDLAREQMDFNAIEAQKQRKWQTEEAIAARGFDRGERLEQQKWQEYMIDKQNEYNSPSAQLQRLMDAGFSPATFDGNVSDSASPTGVPSGSSVGVPNGASASAPSAPSLTAPRWDYDLAALRLMNAQADAAEQKAGLDKTNAQRIKALLDGELKLQDSTWNVLMSEKDKNEKQASLYLKEIERIDAEIPLVKGNLDKIRAEIDNLVKAGELTQKEIDSYEDRLAADLLEVMSRIDLNTKSGQYYLASADAASASAALSREQKELVAKQIIHQGLQNGIIAIDLVNAQGTQQSRLQADLAELGKTKIDAEIDSYPVWNAVRGVLRALGQVFGANANIGAISHMK